MPTCGECAEWTPERWLVLDVSDCGNLGECEKRQAKRLATEEACPEFKPKEESDDG